jgi:hypothetical protein
MKPVATQKKLLRGNGARFLISLLAFAAMIVAGSAFVQSRTVRAGKPDADASRAAFEQVYRVFTSPRCQNCHPAGDAPLRATTATCIFKM